MLVVNHYEKLLFQNSCKIEEIPPEWDRVKAYLELILNLQKKLITLKLGRVFLQMTTLKGNA